MASINFSNYKTIARLAFFQLLYSNIILNKNDIDIMNIEDIKKLYIDNSNENITG